MEALASIRKSSLNPLIKASMAPFPSTLTYNAGIAKYQGRYVMLFRNDYGYTKEQMEAHRDHKAPFPPGRINLGLAFSSDGLKWEIQPKPVTILPESADTLRVYDPRITIIEGVPHVCFAVDTPNGIRGGISRTEDFERFEVLSLSAPDNRNMVLFPEKVNGCYMRLDRPFPVYGCGWKEKFDIWCSDSSDLRYWGGQKLVLGADQVPYAAGKIGPGAPPVRTRAGWLATIHAVEILQDRKLFSWHGGWNKVYYGGLMLLDLDDPSKVIGLSREPILSPEEDYETHGLRGSVIFPGGMILEDSGEVKIYYGAADTVECLATAHIEDLLALCEPVL